MCKNKLSQQSYQKLSQQKFAAIRQSYFTVVYCTCPFKHGYSLPGIRAEHTSQPYNVVLARLYPKILVCIFCTNRLHELTHTCTRSYLALFQNGICYRIMLFPPLHLILLNTIVLRLPCNRVHCLLITAICASLLHFQRTFHRK